MVVTGKRGKEREGGARVIPAGGGSGISPVLPV